MDFLDKLFVCLLLYLIVWKLVTQEIALSKKKTRKLLDPKAVLYPELLDCLKLRRLISFHYQQFLIVKSKILIYLPVYFNKVT